MLLHSFFYRYSALNKIPQFRLVESSTINPKEYLLSFHGNDVILLSVL